MARSRNNHQFTTTRELSRARDSQSPEVRLEEVRAGATKLRDKLLSQDQAVFYKTCDLIRAPYPTKYGFLNAFNRPSPFMHILNRLFIVQYRTSGGIKTLLFSPSDIYGNRLTPFFDRLGKSFGPFEEIGAKLMAPVIGTVEQWLESTGITAEQVDYISYDHLHTQDLKKWLGSKTEPGFFPNAKLIVTKQEWESAKALLPPQADWYCPGGLDGVPEDRVIFFDQDIILGEGVALVRTPGHTEGNHSLVVHTPEGLMVTSENGVSADSYSPLHSRIPGVRSYARKTGMEVILNGNTLEGGLDQYISMVQEKTLAGPSQRNPDFYNVVPSSELTSYWAFPFIKPTFAFGPLEFGRPVTGKDTRPANRQSYRNNPGLSAKKGRKKSAAKR
jgi:hypothetical protein